MIDINSPAVADATSLADFSKPSSDVTNSSFQDALADSLVADGESVPMSSIDIDSASDSRMSEEWESGFDDEPAEPEQYANSEQDDEQRAEPPEFDDEHNAILDDAEQYLAQQQAEANRPLTPAELNAGIQQLGERADQLGMNDQTAAQTLAYNLSVPFGAAPNTIDSQALGSVMSKTVLSALDIYTANGGNLEGLGGIPPAAAQAFTSDLLSAMHVDPRMASVDSNALASLVLGATLNVVDTVNRYGLDARVENFNDPRVAEFFVSNLYRAFGVDAPVNRAEALHIADSFAKYVMSGLRQASARQVQPQPQRSGKRQAASRSGKVLPWNSNRDVFDEEAITYYREQHGKL